MKISLVLPCYNEEANLQKGVLDKIGNFVKEDDRFTEVIIVDDGSSDKSKKFIKEKYLVHFPKFKLIENTHRGKAYAVITGINHSKGDYVMFSDIDLATPIEEANKLINQLKAYSIVIGSRSSQRAGAPLARKIMAKGAIVVRDIFLNLRGIKDTQCGFKLFEKKAAQHIFNHLRVYKDGHTIEGSSVSVGFDIEFLFLATKLGYKIKEIPVVWKHVETHNVNFLKDSFEGFLDILKIKFADLQGKYNNK